MSNISADISEIVTSSHKPHKESQGFRLSLRTSYYCLVELPVIVNRASRFSKVPRTFRARKAIRKTTTYLFCKAGLLICCKGNKNKNNCKVSCLETPSFWRYKENYVTRNKPEKFRDFRETGPTQFLTSPKRSMNLNMSVYRTTHSGFKGRTFGRRVFQWPEHSKSTKLNKRKGAHHLYELAGRIGRKWNASVLRELRMTGHAWRAESVCPQTALSSRSTDALHSRTGLSRLTNGKHPNKPNRPDETIWLFTKRE